MHRTWLLLLMFLTIPAILSAQQIKKVKGQVLTVSGEDKVPLPYASVVVMSQPDSAFVKGVISGNNGSFNIQFSAQKEKKYFLKVSYTGLNPVFRTLNLNTEVVNAGSILLEESAVQLDQVTIVAPVKEIELVGDTTVINTSAYKTHEGSYLEDLVKLIPGLEYNSMDQSLTYNGLPIKEINVNGESFFSGDKRMALENLPANLISKIKVYDKKSELEKITGVSKGQENYVLDLQTKEEFDGTIMASGKAGFGNYSKKDYELLGNYFKMNGESASLIARSSNRNMMTNYKGNIQNSVGANFVKKFGKELTFSGNMFFNHNKSGNESTAFSEQYLTNGNKYSSSANENSNLGRMMNSSADMRWQINKRTYLNVSGNFSFNNMDYSTSNRQAAFNENPNLDIKNPFENIGNVPDEIRLNDNISCSISSNSQHQYAVSANITHEINEKGSSVSLTMSHSDGEGDNENFINSSTTYYQLQNSLGNDSILYRNQYQLSPTESQNRSVGLLFTHPIMEKLRMQFTYNFNYNKERSNRNTYDLSGFQYEGAGSPGYLPGDYETGYTDSLSNRSYSRTTTHELGLHLNYSSEIWDVNAGISVQPEQRALDQKTGLMQADTTTRTTGLQPSVLVAWKKDKKLLRLSYQGYTRQPSLHDLLSLTDNSDPLNISSGNPDLKPTYSHSIRLEAHDTKKGIFASVSLREDINSQTRTVTYDTITGGRETYPININGNWGADGSIRYTKRIRKFNISANAGGTYGQNVSLVNENQNETPDRSETRNTGLNSLLSLSYQPEWGAVSLMGNWRFQHSANSLRETDIRTHNYMFGLNAHVNLPGNIHINTDAFYSFRNGTNIQKNEDDQVVWNFNVTWRFLKKKQAELSLNWADILSQRKSFSRNATANGFYERHSQQIAGYFLVSMKYRFNQPLR